MTAHPRPQCDSTYGGRRCHRDPHEDGDHDWTAPDGEAENWPRELDSWLDGDLGRVPHAVEPEVIELPKLDLGVSALGRLQLSDIVDICPDLGCGGQMAQMGACKQCTICGFGGSCG